MKIISYNINSLRLRLPLLEKIVKQLNPDVVCLQETKVDDPAFPLKKVKKLGFDFVEFSGEKSYNGVAILSKFPVKDISKIDILEYGHKRHISCIFDTKIGEINLHNFYIPAGGDIPDVNLNDKFRHKLGFVDWMSSYFANENEKNKQTIILGDFNIAPFEHDVWSHKQLLKVVSHTPIEVEKLNNLKKTLNWIDSHRLFVDEKEKLYSWWSYRGLEPFKSNRGRRLDHIWLTPNLKNHIKAANIYKDFRLSEKPSDHVPIELVLQNV